MTKKVLLMTFEYPVGRGYCGGVGQIVEQSRKALLDTGYEVYVLIGSSFKKKHPVKLMLPDDKLLSYRNFWSFAREHQWHKFSYIIHHFVNWTNELKKIKSQKGRRPRIIYHFHSILRREKDSGFRTLNHFLANQEKMIAIADKIICPSRYEHENFARYFPSFLDKVALVENSFESFPMQKKHIRKIRSTHGVRKEDIVSLYVGRLERIKGADVILKNIPAILQKHKRVKLFMVGKVLDKNLYQRLLKLKKRFPEQLFYIRYLEKSELFQYYYLSQIYINSSLSESFSLSTHESALCNNALLLNRLPVLEKFKDAAVFFDVNNEEFANKFDSLIRNKRLRESLPRRASRIAKNYLDKNRLQEDLSELLVNLN